MLHAYWTSAGYIPAETVGAIACAAEQKTEALDASKRYPECGITSPKTYRTRESSKPQTAAGRVRAAVARIYAVYGHATCGSIARQFLKCARHVRLDRDNPNTHLAFSPNGVGPNNVKGRRSLTFAKFLRRKCGALIANRLALSDAKIETAQSGFQLVAQFNTSLNLITGESALDVYALSDDVGIRSCMSAECSEFLAHHFRANPKTIQLVTAHHKEHLVIRAKLFANDDNSTHFLDRIYWKQTGAFEHIDKESEVREWVATWLAGQGYSLSDRCDCTLNHDQGEPMPYLDRCRQFDRDGDTIRLHSRGKFSADNTDGKDASCDDDRPECCACGCRVDEDESHCPDYGSGIYCDDCYSDLFSWDEVHECDISSDDAVSATRIGRNGRHDEVTTHRDNCHELHDGNYGLQEDCVELDNGNYALSDDDDVTSTYDDRYALYSDCVQLHNGDWALSDDDDVRELHDGEFALDCECVELHNGDFALSDDAEELDDGSYGLIGDDAPVLCASWSL